MIKWSLRIVDSIWFGRGDCWQYSDYNLARGTWLYFGDAIERPWKFGLAYDIGAILIIIICNMDCFKSGVVRRVKQTHITMKYVGPKTFVLFSHGNPFPTINGHCSV